MDYVADQLPSSHPLNEGWLEHLRTPLIDVNIDLRVIHTFDAVLPDLRC